MDIYKATEKCFILTKWQNYLAVFPVMEFLKMQFHWQLFKKKIRAGNTYRSFSTLSRVPLRYLFMDSPPPPLPPPHQSHHHQYHSPHK